MLFSSIGHDWRPRSSWKLPSSHPGCRAIQPLKELSECLKAAEEGWEFLSHWKRLKDINFYNHYVFPLYFCLTHGSTPFSWVAHYYFLYPSAGNLNGIFLFFLLLFFLSCCLWDFRSRFLADMCEREVDLWNKRTGQTCRVGGCLGC